VRICGISVTAGNKGCRGYHRIILDESKRKFSYLGTKVDGLRSVTFSLVDNFPLELGKALSNGSKAMRWVISLT
jgi:hypothetical protein